MDFINWPAAQNLDAALDARMFDAAWALDTARLRSVTQLWGHNDHLRAAR